MLTLLPGRHVTVEELQTFVGTPLAAFKVPTRVWFEPGYLPRNPAGKVLKRDLRSQLTG